MELAQRDQALAMANQIRCEAARVRREFASKDGMTRAAKALESPSEIVARMRVGYFLTGIRQVQLTRAMGLAHEAGLAASALQRRIGPVPDLGYGRELSERQRLLLASVLRRAAKGRR